jgi:energy-coupling factor transporter ATP-binding protein EcfA2
MPSLNRRTAICPSFEEDRQCGGGFEVELRPGASLHFSYRHGDRQCRPEGSVAGDGVEGICHLHDPSGDRQGLSVEAARIPFSVHPLVMVEHYRRNLGEHDVDDQAMSLERMDAYHPPLGSGQPCRLPENLFGHGQLADVVEMSCGIEVVEGVDAASELGCDGASHLCRAVHVGRQRRIAKPDDLEQLLGDCFGYCLVCGSHATICLSLPPHRRSGPGPDRGGSVCETELHHRQSPHDGRQIIAPVSLWARCGQVKACISLDRGNRPHRRVRLGGACCATINAMAWHGGEDDSLVLALRGVADALGGLSLIDGVGEGRRRDLQSAICGYLIPRLADPEAPLVVAVVGGSGSGKSTLVNSLARRRLSSSGPLRPTTVEPLAWAGAAIPPVLTGASSPVAAGRVVTDPPPAGGLVLVDTPPPSVVGAGGVPVAAAVLAVADACVFVASGIRYADAAGWDLIGAAVERNLYCVFVLNRMPQSGGTQEMLQRDLARQLVACGALQHADPGAVIGVAEGPILGDRGGLPPEWVTGLARELDALADPRVRGLTVRRAISGSLDRLEKGLQLVRGDLVEAMVEHLALLEAVEAPYRVAADDLVRELAEGDLAGCGGRRGLHPRDLAAVVARRAGKAARVAASAWEAHPAGAAIVGRHPELWVRRPETVVEATEKIDGWSRDLGALAGRSGRRGVMPGAGRKTARALGRMAVDPSFVPDGRWGHRRLPAGAATEARRGLAGVLQEILVGDAARFTEALGQPPGGALLTRLRLPEGDR